jgi:hypothetical protein
MATKVSDESLAGTHGTGHLRPQFCYVQFRHNSKKDLSSPGEFKPSKPQCQALNPARARSIWSNNVFAKTT